MSYTYDPLINTSLDNYIENYVFDYYFEIKLNGSIKNLSADIIQNLNFYKKSLIIIFLLKILD